MASPRTSGRDRGGPRAAENALLGKQGYLPVRTGGRQGTRGTKESFPQPPANWNGTLPEWAIYWAHLTLGLKPDEDFQYIPRLTEATGTIKGAQVDFYEVDLDIAVDIQGMYWHYGLGAAKQVDDQEQRARIEAIGVTYVAIDEDDALHDPVFYLTEARNGRDHSLAARGVG